ncbi:MAG: helix-turn-helix domain-containing protein [Mariprofundus sp.]|nr:helix-turn-helix domain-containing protein [Mariprofundus sp.]
MMWTAVLRFGSLLSLAGAALQLYDKRFQEIKPNKIYTSEAVAKFLGISRVEVVQLSRAGLIRAHLGGGNYHITGQSILEYIGKEGSHGNKEDES